MGPAFVSARGVIDQIEKKFGRVGATKNEAMPNSPS